MRIEKLHPWNVTPAEAAKIRMDLEERISQVEGFDKIERVGGVDVSYKKDSSKAAAAAVEFVLKCTTKFRIPEPLRTAHHLSQSFNPE